MDAHEAFLSTEVSKGRIAAFRAVRAAAKSTDEVAQAQKVVQASKPFKQRANERIEAGVSSALQKPIKAAGAAGAIGGALGAGVGSGVGAAMNRRQPVSKRKPEGFASRKLLNTTERVGPTAVKVAGPTYGASKLAGKWAARAAAKGMRPDRAIEHGTLAGGALGMATGGVPGAVVGTFVARSAAKNAVHKSAFGIDHG